MVDIPCRVAVRSHILKQWEEAKKFTRKQLAGAELVCLTADCWSSKKHRHLGVTSHWLAHDFSRKSAVLTFRCFMGKHNFEAIAQELSSVIADYGLTNQKIVSIVTDNGSNFVKAFAEYGIHPNAVDIP